MWHWNFAPTDSGRLLKMMERRTMEVVGHPDGHQSFGRDCRAILRAGLDAVHRVPADPDYAAGIKEPLAEVQTGGLARVVGTKLHISATGMTLGTVVPDRPVITTVHAACEFGLSIRLACAAT